MPSGLHHVHFFVPLEQFALMDSCPGFLVSKPQRALYVPGLILLLAQEYQKDDLEGGWRRHWGLAWDPTVFSHAIEARSRNLPAAATM
jgi:hypothetical protein